MKIGKRHEISRSTAILGAAALLALAIVLTWGDAETKTLVKEWLGWGWAVGASLLGPLIRRRAAEAVGVSSEDEPDPDPDLTPS